jgi:tRNA(Leu) C34 or U34 (ribose-2'-O)-methylase TrmL
MNIVLYQPEIPQNTGNIGRTCVALNMKLWLVRPMGFRLDSTQVKRAGLDYWEHLDYEICESWDDLWLKLYPDAGLIKTEPMALATVTNSSTDSEINNAASAYGSGRPSSSPPVAINTFEPPALAAHVDMNTIRTAATMASATNSGACTDSGTTNAASAYGSGRPSSSPPVAINTFEPPALAAHVGMNTIRTAATMASATNSGACTDSGTTNAASAYGLGRAGFSSGDTGAMWFFTKFATRSYTDVQFRSNDVLVFGSETSGLPDSIHQKYADQRLFIPMPGKVRSLNLATSVGIAAYEAFRQLNLLAK